VKHLYEKAREEHNELKKEVAELKQENERLKSEREAERDKPQVCVVLRMCCECVAYVSLMCC
jgi:predicted nuclease with TOPRIM domain